MTGRRVHRLLLQAARHTVMQTRGVGQQAVRMQSASDHGGELVVRGAEIGAEEAADVGVALQGGVMLMQARRVMVMMRGHQRVQVLVVLLLRTAMVDGGAGLLGTGRAFVSGRTVLAGYSRACRRRHHRRGRLMLLMLLVLVGLPRQLLLLVLEPLLAPQVAAVLEHIAAVRVQGPEGSLARLVRRARHLDEAVVEAERVPDGVLPALLILPVEREQIHDELIDLREGQHLVRCVLYRHGDEADVGVRGLRVRVTASVRLVASRALQRRVRRVRLGERQGIPGDAGTAAGRQRAVSDGAHTRAARAHGSAAVTAHTTAAHRRHGHGRRAHAAHVEAAGALRAAAGPYPDAHRHAHRHAAHRVDRAVRGRHAAHTGHRSAGHRTRVAVQLLRLYHCHRAHRSGLLPRRRCQAGIMKTAVPRLLAVRYFLNLPTGRRRSILESTYRAPWLVAKPSVCLSAVGSRITDSSNSSNFVRTERTETCVSAAGPRGSRDLRVALGASLEGRTGGGGDEKKTSPAHTV